MATITFDTQELVTKLKAAGFAPEQADAVVRAIVDSHKEVVTRDYLDNRLETLEQRITAKLYQALLIQTFALATIFGVIVSAVKFL